MVDSETFKVGIYLRLSREDEKDGESGSISSQRDILLDYIKEHNLLFVEQYIDDGISGTQFDREGFNQMIKDLIDKKINMVMTKDMSRLGRNNSESTYYIETFFPENKIRYVSLIDGIDTFDENNYANDMVQFKGLMNEQYVKDISRKIKSSVTNKRKNGKFLGSSAPYGYIKDPNDKYKLIIDEPSADIVRRIFNLFISGEGICKICKILNDEKIPIPSIYKKLNRGLKSTAFGTWNNRTVSDMLTLPTYCGDLTQGRLKKVSYKSKKIIRNKPKDWIKCNDMCPAIVDKETFEIAQNIYQRNKNQGKHSQDILLKGFVYCKECKHTIGFRLQKATTKSKGEVIRCYGNCNYWAKHKTHNVCTPHNMNYYELEDIVLGTTKKLCKQYIKTSNLKEILKSNDKTVKLQKDLELRLNKLKNEISLSNDKIDALYSDKLNGIIDTEMYKRHYNMITESTIENKNEIKEIEEKINNIKNKITGISEKQDEIIKEFLSMKKPDIRLLSNIIDKVIIDEDKNIDILYKIKPLNNGY